MPEAGKLLTVSEYFGVSLDELMKEGGTAAQTAPPEQTPPEPKEGETGQPEQGSQKKRRLGLIICLGGLICLILWSLLSLLFPRSSQQLAASSEVRLDGSGVLLGLCVAAIVTGAVLLLKNSKDK